MASYTVTTAKHATLTADTVDTVTLGEQGGYIVSVEVLNRGTTDIYATTNGTTPTVGGDNTVVVVAGGGLKLTLPGPSATVKLISSGAPAYSVTGIGA